MRKFLARFENVIWTALLALTAAWATLISAVVGAPIEIVAGFGLCGFILATLSPKS